MAPSGSVLKIKKANFSDSRRKEAQEQRSQICFALSNCCFWMDAGWEYLPTETAKSFRVLPIKERVC